jgi:dihydrofolate reductase
MNGNCFPPTTGGKKRAVHTVSLRKLALVHFRRRKCSEGEAARPRTNATTLTIFIDLSVASCQNYLTATVLGKQRMRRIKYFVANSLDGFISRPDGGVDWLFMDQDYGMAEFFRSVDVAVMGRKTYDKMLELAPGQAFYPGIKNYVFSTTRPSGVRDGVEFVSTEVDVWTERVRAEQGKDIWLVGGGGLVRQFLQARLVDEIGLTIHPRLLGNGIPLFPQPYPETELELIRCEKYSTGLVQVFYRVRQEGPSGIG